MEVPMHHPNISLIAIFIYATLALSANSYISNKKCKECHETIYDEYKRSAHALSYFSDELHRKVAQASNPKRYSCAPCHMPAVSNISELISGKASPNRNDKRALEGVSCYFCHTIAMVKKAHRYNINIPARQAKGYKPSLFGPYNNPDDSDKHSSLKSPIYIDMVCMGCHSHKINESNVTIFSAMHPTDNSRGCVRCHMPMVPGGAEKRNTRNRSEHHSHRFLGIRDAKFRAKGYRLSVARERGGIAVSIENRMPHPMIIQPARAKYLKITVIRDGKVIWQNYRKSPSEDKQGYFVYRFFKNGRAIYFPAHADSKKVNNLLGKEIRTLHYKIDKLRSGDRVRVGLYARLAKEDCLKVINLRDKHFTEPFKIKELEWVVP